MNPEEWMAVFTADGVVCDPVGTPAKLVKEASGEFFGLLQRFYASLSVTSQSVFLAGDGAAAQWRMDVVAKNGKQANAEGISVFEFSADNKLKKVSSYWDESALMMQLKG